jgi:hypothetical protein
MNITELLAVQRQVMDKEYSYKMKVYWNRSIL